MAPASALVVEIALVAALALGCGGGGAGAEGDADVLPADVLPADVLPAEAADGGVEVDGPDPASDEDGDGLSAAEEAELGTDPSVADSDTDGVDDGDEVAEGTNPLDPSSARAWHPEWSGHPRLLFDAADVPAIAAKLDLDTEPFTTLAGRIRARAAAGTGEQPTDDYDPVIATQRGRVAKSAAFLALIEGDEAAAERAFELLSTINPRVDLVTLGHPEFDRTDIHAAEALASYSLAADWYLATPHATPERAAVVQEAIAELAARFEEAATTGWLALLLGMTQNNHNIKTFSSIGLAGMLLNDRPEAARWVSRGVGDAFHYATEVQTTPDGGYAEGPGYLNYSAGELLPLLYAHHRVAAGRALLFRNFGETRQAPPDGEEWGVQARPDPADDAILRALFWWPQRLMMPGGLAPNLDDAPLAAWVGAAYGAVLFDDPGLLWMWFRPAQGFVSDGGSELAPDLLALLPAGVQAGAPPDFLDQDLPDAGQVVFRDGWGEDATWALLLGEHDVARKSGRGHEHPDANEVLFAARGEYLLLDSGYISWSEHEAVNAAINHSIVLVDGEGPPVSVELAIFGADAWLSGYEVAPDYKTAVSSTSYGGAELERRIVLLADAPRPDILIIHDRISADAPHEYSWLLHGNGGGTSGGELALREHGATWTRALAAADAVVGVRGGGLACDSIELVHSFSYGQKSSHEALRCTTSGSSTAILAAVRVGPGLGDPEAAPLEAPEVREISGGVALRLPREGGSTWVVSAAEGTLVETDCGDLVIDAPLTAVTCAGSTAGAVASWQ